MRQGHYSMPEISEILRHRLLEQYVYAQQEESDEMTAQEQAMAEADRTVEAALAQRRASRK